MELLAEQKLIFLKNLTRQLDNLSQIQWRINAHLTEEVQIFQGRWIIIQAKVARASCYCGFLGLQTSENAHGNTQLQYTFLENLGVGSGE